MGIRDHPQHCWKMAAPVQLLQRLSGLDLRNQTVRLPLQMQWQQRNAAAADMITELTHKSLSFDTASC